MNTNDHSRFLAFTAEHETIIEAHRISGEGCYILNMNTASGKELNERLNEILHSANYRRHISIDQVK
ncbi:Lrp/AsnC ligand binding domain-containing protein [Bacillus swezeyi]|uniref:Lrp/AsnC ligand binding domain-containing protein n=1 Tax=Bacillus swezeyi TaxID=1925020 RepID=UPI002E1C0BBF|nr:Lrp/AsnC ligand binding domain-containing protein [Bacillus swezeyi]